MKLQVACLVVDCEQIVFFTYEGSLRCTQGKGRNYFHIFAKGRVRYPLPLFALATLAIVTATELGVFLKK